MQGNSFLPASLSELLFFRVQKAPDEILFEYKIPPRSDDVRHINQWKSVTAAQFQAQTLALAEYLRNLGLGPGSSLAILARSTYYTVLLDFAAAQAGIVTVPIYETASARQIEQIMKATRAQIIYVHNPNYAQNTPEQFQKLYSSDITGAVSGADSASAATSAAVTGAPGSAGEALAALISTAGTNGESVIVEYTQADYLKNALAVAAQMQAAGADLSFYLNFLSLAHIAPRIFLYAAIYSGARIGVTPGVRDLLGDLQFFQPTFFVSVPRVYDKLFAEISDRHIGSLLGLGWRRKIRKAFNEPASEKFKQGIAKMLGGRLQTTFSTAQKPDPKLLKFFENIGIPAFDCYSVTEAKGIVTLSTPQQNKIGSVGRPLEGVSVEIVNSEIIVNGFNTGDIGSLDEDGFLEISGKTKDVITMSSGKSILPELLQQALAADPAIEDVILIGERRPYISALISLNSEHIETLLEDCGLDESSAEAAILIDKQVQKAVDTSNKLVSRDEQIRRYLILEDGFAVGEELLSGSLKLRRDRVCKYYKDLINGVLYSN